MRFLQKVRSEMTRAVEDGTYPPCFDSAEEWHSYLGAYMAAGEAISPCQDCVNGYSAKMYEQGRCKPNQMPVFTQIDPWKKTGQKNK